MLSSLKTFCLYKTDQPKNQRHQCHLTQVCDDGGWSYATWLFTLQPGVFGLVRGIANPTGIILIVINLIMTVFSMPFIRRSR